VSLAIRELGGDAISFTGSQSGIITNDRHVDARIIEVRPFRVQDELARGRIVVVAGYQGVSYKREVTTLGRGGSDTTAVAMAAALDAEYCEICSDVDGVYSADPRAVPAATRIGTLSYEETQEMAEAGAKVLNAQAVEFAKDKGIAIYARATQGPLPGEHSYLKTITDLKETVDGRKDAVFNASGRVAFERDLAVVNDAIKRTQKVVRSNPRNQAARQGLYSAYQDKIDLLNTVAQRDELIASTR